MVALFFVAGVFAGLPALVTFFLAGVFAAVLAAAFLAFLELAFLEGECGRAVRGLAPALIDFLPRLRLTAFLARVVTTKFLLG